MRLLANSWTPEQWVAIITAISAGVSSVVVGAITALKTHAIHGQNQDIQREIKPPSNGKTLGTLVEQQEQILSFLANLHADKEGVPGPMITTIPVQSSIPQPNPILSPPQQERSDKTPPST